LFKDLIIINKKKTEYKKNRSTFFIIIFFKRADTVKKFKGHFPPAINIISNVKEIEIDGALSTTKL
jgi:hypothetical protein